ncbi:unnamed protein product, partial [Choristocarpus tenellus]
VARLWGKLLKVEETSILPTSDFFDLGGHSLLLAKLSTEILNNTGARVSITDILERSSLRNLSKLLEERMMEEREGTEASIGSVAERSVC